jgi:hypothetical protein
VRRSAGVETVTTYGRGNGGEAFDLGWDCDRSAVAVSDGLQEVFPLIFYCFSARFCNLAVREV